MPSNSRISQHYKDKKTKRGQYPKFVPNLDEWREACLLYCYDKQIAKHFDISHETFYRFIDRQRHEKDQGRPAEFLDTYKLARNTTKKQVLNKLLSSNETAALIFSAKTFGGLTEKKDDKEYELKKKEFELKQKEFELKQKEFLAKLGEKFQLDYEQLKEFVEKFFEENKKDNEL